MEPRGRVKKARGPALMRWMTALEEPQGRETAIPAVIWPHPLPWWTMSDAMRTIALPGRLPRRRRDVWAGGVECGAAEIGS